MQIVRLSEKILQRVYLLQKYTDDGWSEEQLRAELSNSCAIGLCMLINYEVVAFLSCHAVCDEANINNIITDINHRGKGYAKALLTALDTELVDRGVKNIFLEVRSNNQSAIALYEGRNFIQVGKRMGFYTNPNDDALLFKKEIIKG